MSHHISATVSAHSCVVGEGKATQASTPMNVWTRNVRKKLPQPIFSQTWRAEAECGRAESHWTCCNHVHTTRAHMPNASNDHPSHPDLRFLFFWSVPCVTAAAFVVSSSGSAARDSVSQPSQKDQQELLVTQNLTRSNSKLSHIDVTPTIAPSLFLSELTPFPT